MTSKYREKYESVYGKIPKDYEVHHKDFNHKNNDIENLIAVSKDEHRRLHYEHSRNNKGNKPKNEKATSIASRNAIAKYDKKNTKGIYLKLNKSTDKDILDKLERTSNVQGYIKKLILDDIQKETLS